MESYPRLYISGSKIEGKTERFQHATDYAHALDKRTFLDPTNSTVERHSLTTIESSPASVYIHTNSKQYLNELLLKEEQEEVQDAVMRTFLECLYGTFGYVPQYDREPGHVPKFNRTRERFDNVFTESPARVSPETRAARIRAKSLPLMKKK